MLLALFAASIAPNVARQIEASKKRGYRQSVLILLRQARNEAIWTRLTTNVTIEENAFSISQTEADSTTTLKRVEAVNGVEVSHEWINGSEVGESEWKIAFYPDGTSSGGGFQFDEGSNSQSVSVKKSSGEIVTTNNATNPSIEDDSEWEAGTIVEKS